MKRKCDLKWKFPRWQKAFAPDYNGDDGKKCMVRVRNKRKEKACVYNHKLILLFLSLCFAHSTLLMPSTIFEANTSFFLKCKFWCLLANLSSQTLVFCVITSEREKISSLPKFWSYSSESSRGIFPFSSLLKVFFCAQLKMHTKNPSLDFSNNLHRRWKKNRKLVQTFFFLTLSPLNCIYLLALVNTQEWENKQQRCEKSLMWKSILSWT